MIAQHAPAIDVLQQAQRILLLVSERVGDVIFCTPAIHLLKHNRPQATIDVIAPSVAAAQVLENNPYINRVITVGNPAGCIQFAADYEVLIDLHNSRKTRACAEQFAIPQVSSPRIGAGHQSAVAVEFMQSLLPGFSVPQGFDGGYELFPAGRNHAHIDSLLAEVDNNTLLIGCHMGSNRVARKSGLLKRLFRRNDGRGKSWPVERFVELARRLHGQYPHMKLVLTGTPAESHLIKAFAKQDDFVIDLIGQTSVADLAALMARLKVFVTGDTGPLHVASATPVPLVCLFGPTEPKHYGPRPAKDFRKVIYKDTLDDISVDDVVAAVEQLIESKN
jgi:ADP-heptose:LPS heptosyltransferase